MPNSNYECGNGTKKITNKRVAKIAALYLLGKAYPWGDVVFFSKLYFSFNRKALLVVYALKIHLWQQVIKHSTMFRVRGLSTLRQAVRAG
jgi:hypothetical protein